MALYDYPHTGNYDQDLGFLIKRYKELIEEYKSVNDKYETLLKIYEMVQKDIKEVTIEQLQKWLDDGVFEELINEALLKMTYVKVTNEQPSNVRNDSLLFLNGYSENITLQPILSMYQAIKELKEEQQKDFQNRQFGVCTFNCVTENSFRSKGFQYTETLINTLNLVAQTKCEIACLNEVYDTIWEPFVETYSNDIYNNGSFISTWDDILPSINYGVGLVSMFNVTSSSGGKYRKLEGQNEYQGYTLSKMNLYGETLSVYSTHFDYQDIAITSQVQELFNIVSKDTSKYIVIAGDFNFDLTKYEQYMPQFKGSGFKQVNGGKYKTYNDNRNLAIDEILVSANINIIESGIIDTQTWSAYDHNLLWAKLGMGA